MTETKKERVMSAKGFLHKATTKAAASAGAFLATHRAWLVTGDLASLTRPILSKLDSKEIMPTPALEAIRAVVLGHMIAGEIRKGEEAMNRREEQENASPKNWTATIYNPKGEIQTRINAKGEVEDLQQSFDKAQEADGWTDRKLVEGASDWFGVISHATMVNRQGDPISTTVMRIDAMARVFKQAKGAVCKSQVKSAGKLSFGVKVKENRSRFSGG